MKAIEELYFSVVVTNGDCYIIENDEQAEELKNMLGNSIVEEVTEEEEFGIASEKLDFSKQVQPRHIFRMQNSNPNESGYVCFAEDYGD